MILVLGWILHWIKERYDYIYLTDTLDGGWLSGLVGWWEVLILGILVLVLVYWMAFGYRGSLVGGRY